MSIYFVSVKFDFWNQRLGCDVEYPGWRKTKLLCPINWGCAYDMPLLFTSSPPSEMNGHIYMCWMCFTCMQCAEKRQLKISTTKKYSRTIKTRVGWFKPWFKPMKKIIVFLVWLVFLVLMALMNLNALFSTNKATYLKTYFFNLACMTKYSWVLQ